MGSLLNSLASTAGAIRVYDRALEVIQNNVSNASTPGYAAARLNLIAAPFDPNAGIGGGVRAGSIDSSRDSFLERSVWTQQNFVGRFTQESQSLAPVEQVLGITSDAAIPTALNELFQGFSQLATSPNDVVLRQQVLDAAGQVASSFNGASTSLSSIANDVNQQIRITVDHINNLVGQVHDYNLAIGAGAVALQDAGSDSQVYANLESLSQLVDFTVTRDSSGQFDLRLGNGQSALLLGNQQFAISSDFSHAQTAILASSGEDVTSQAGSGQLAALLDTRNTQIPSFSADLDRLAQSFASQINSTLANGLDSSGNPGAPLYTYDASSPANTLSVTSISANELAAATADAPGGSENAQNLAALANQPVLDGQSFSQFYGTLAGRVGQQKASADQNQQLRQQLLSQAQAMRQQTSGVSLDEEATRLIQFQRAYQASAQLLAVLSSLTGTVINLLQP